MNGRPCTIVTRDGRVREPRAGAARWKGNSPRKNPVPTKEQWQPAAGTPAVSLVGCDMLGWV